MALALLPPPVLPPTPTHKRKADGLLSPLARLQKFVERAEDEEDAAAGEEDEEEEEEDKAPKRRAPAEGEEEEEEEEEEAAPAGEHGCVTAKEEKADPEPIVSASVVAAEVRAAAAHKEPGGEDGDGEDEEEEEEEEDAPAQPKHPTYRWLTETNPGPGGFVWHMGLPCTEATAPSLRLLDVELRRLDAHRVQGKRAEDARYSLSPDPRQRTVKSVRAEKVKKERKEKEKKLKARPVQQQTEAERLVQLRGANGIRQYHVLDSVMVNKAMIDEFKSLSCADLYKRVRALVGNSIQ